MVKTKPTSDINGNGPAVQPASSKAGKNSPSPQPYSPQLIICRNKHWRYISSFHGPWLQLPIEVLETLANANYYMPLPRPVDPAVFYDLVKIRRLVDDATDLAVRAANGTTSSNGYNSSFPGGAGQHIEALGLGYRNGTGAKLSAERKHRIREQATQKLSLAYHLDEIACSVATMQATSTLENVSGLVLQRAPNDPDANYVQFFHEKIPSRRLAECTDVRALDPIINTRPSDCEPLRTRATVHMFKEEYESAIQDLTVALRICRLHQSSHRSEEVQLAPQARRRWDDAPLEERDQPSSTEVQLLFQRAGCYLTLACRHIWNALPQCLEEEELQVNRTPEESNGEDTPTTPISEPSASEKRAQKEQLEQRKTVRLYAKRALRDYMEYLKHFHYTAELPVGVSDDFTRKVNMATNGVKRYDAPQPTSPAGPPDGHQIYTLSDLFSATPPGNLPPYPVTELMKEPTPTVFAVETTTEAVTYHPLLTDALHSLLICHALVQTSAKELQRHAYMVARLARLADGYPIFQASRSPARADWIDVLRKGDNWVDLSSSWESLCAPAPVLTSIPGSEVNPTTAHMKALAITDGRTRVNKEETTKDRAEREALFEALENEYVHDEASLKAVVSARQQLAQDQNGSITNPGDSTNGSIAKRWAIDDGREYPLLSERATAVARWVKEAPIGGTGTKRKKKTGTKKPTITEEMVAADVVASG